MNELDKENKLSESNEKEPDNQKTGKRNLGFYLKVFGVFFLCVCASLTIAVFYLLNRLTNDSNFEKLVNKKVSESTGMDISFQKIGINFPSIELANIRIATDSADIRLESHIGSAKIRPDFIAALSGNIIIDLLEIASSSTTLELKAVKSTDKTVGKKTDTPPLDLDSIEIPFRSMSISDIKFKLVDVASKTDYNLLLNKAAITYSLFSSALPYDIDAEWVDKASLKATGDLYWFSRILANADLKIKDIKEVKKYIPAEYHKFLNNITDSTVRASLDYNINKNLLRIKDYSVKVEPLAALSGSAEISTTAPLKVKASAKTDSLNTENIWQLAKDFVPSEAGIASVNGNVQAEFSVGLDGDKPIELSASVKPEELGVLTAFVPDKFVLKKGVVAFDGKNLTISDFDTVLANTSIHLKSLSLALKDLSLSSSFGVKSELSGLIKSLQSYISEDFKRVDVWGNIAASGSIKGKLSDVSSLIVDGELTTNNVKITDKPTSTTGTLGDLKIKLNGIGKERGTISIENVKATTNGAVLVANGKIKNKKDLEFDCKTSGNINVGDFTKLAVSLFGLPIKENQYRGNLGVDIKLGGSLKNPKPSGKIAAKDIYADIPECGMAIESFNGNIAVDSDKLVFNKVKAKVFGGDLDFNGIIRDFHKMKVEAVANIKDTDLTAVRKMIGAFVPEMEKELTFAGKADLSASLNGYASAPAIKGSATLIDACFNHPAVFRPIEKINGHITFDNGGLNTEGVTAYWGTSKADLSGSLKDWAKFIADLKFNVAPLDVTDAAGFFLNGTGYEVIGSGVGNGTVTGPLEKIKVTCAANVDVGTVTAVISEGGEAMKFPFSKLTANAAYCDNVLDIATATLQLFTGDVMAKAKISIASEPIRYDVDAKIKQIMTQEFLKVNSEEKYHKTLEGGIDGFAKFSGDVTGLSSINGSANLSMPSGKYDSPKIVKKLADILKNPSLASGTIENVSGDYSIANGRISSNNVMGTSKDSKAVFRGSVGLDTTLDGTLELELGKRTCDSSYLKELLGDSETLKLSCKVKGSLTSPDIDLPLNDIAKKSAMNEVNKILEKNKIDLKGTEKAVDELAEHLADKVTDKFGDLGKKLNKSLKKLFK